MFFPVAVATMVGIRTVDPRLLELGRSLRATRRQRLWTIEVPSALPSIFGGLRVGIPLMFATLLTIALVGIALYVVVVLVERRLVGAR